MKTKSNLSGITHLGLLSFLMLCFNVHAQEKWVAPASNPIVIKH